MASAGWYNENLYRDLPFLTRIEPLSANDLPAPLLDLPQDAIVDFGAIMDLAAEYSEADGHYVYLHAVSRYGDRLHYDFRTNAPGGDDHRLVFIRDTTTDAEFSSEWVDSALIETSATSGTLHPDSSEPGCTTPKWRGFLVTGRYDDLMDMLLDGETLYSSNALWQIEPARVQSLMDGHVRAINMANGGRQHALPPDDCAPPVEDTSLLVTIARCIQGDIVFVEGFNVTIAQDDQNNRLTIGAAVGAGAGRQCAEVPVFVGETASDDSPFLTGGPSCRQILKTINGQGGRHLQIRAGRGIEIYADPDQPNTLVVDRSLHDFANCLVPDSSSLSSEGG